MDWLVGDIQGCVRPFERLLRAIDFTVGRDTLWCLGDLINRGPESLATLRLWRDVDGRGVLGNHDVYGILAFLGHWQRKQSDTLEDLFAAKDADALLARLAALPILAALPASHADPSRQSVWMVHAGIHPTWQSPLDAIAQKLNAGPTWGGQAQVLRRYRDLSRVFAFRVRGCHEDGALTHHTCAPDELPKPAMPWDHWYQGDALIAHGHWAARGHYRSSRSMGLDSGCVYGGPLTAWCWQEDRIVQVR